MTVPPPSIKVVEATCLERHRGEVCGEAGSEASTRNKAVSRSRS